MKFPIGDQVIQRGSGGQPALPGGLRLLRNAGQAAVRNLAGIVSGEPLRATTEQRHERKAICEQCEYFRDIDERCSHVNCGCYLKYKTWLHAEHCPERKW